MTPQQQCFQAFYIEKPNSIQIFKKMKLLQLDFSQILFLSGINVCTPISGSKNSLVEVVRKNGCSQTFYVLKCNSHVNLACRVALYQIRSKFAFFYNALVITLINIPWSTKFVNAEVFSLWCVSSNFVSQYNSKKLNKRTKETKKIHEKELLDKIKSVDEYL